MAIDVKKVKEQSAFCLDLMERLNSEIGQDVSKSSLYGIFNHTQNQSDIIRLRRELNALNKMLFPYGEG